MRSLIVIIATAFVAVIAFSVYWWNLRPDGPDAAYVDKRGKTRATRPSTRGSGEKVWLENYDKKTARLISRIRAERLDPMADGRVRAIQPRCEFFLNDGQVITIMGRDGHIVMEERIGGSGLPGGNRTPTRGTLRDVTLRLLPSNRAGAKPTLTLTLNNAAFDNEELRIYTEACEIDGKKVPGDEVPVVVRGDYDFNGRGLEIRWNEVDRRLEYLKVSHGERLVIKKVDGLLPDLRPTTRISQATRLPSPVGMGTLRTAATGAIAAAVAWVDPTAITHAMAAQPAEAGVGADDAADAADGTTATRPAPKRRPMPVYRAVFADDVRVNYTVPGEPVLTATSAKMQVDFRPKDSGDSADETASTQPTTRRAPATARTTTRRSSSATTRSTSRPTTLATPAAPAVEITWRGPLVVTPLEAQTDRAFAAGDAAIRMSGPSVDVKRGDMSVSSAALTYRTGEKLVTLEAGTTPVVLDGGTAMNGIQAKTQRATLSMARSEARLEGRSSALLPLADEGTTRPATQPAQTLAASWSDSCVLQFAGLDGPEVSLHRATITGDVSVTHPQLSLAAQSMVLGFDRQSEPEATTRPATAPVTPRSGQAPRVQTVLRQLDATDNVRCTIWRDQSRQSIECRHLRLDAATLPDGRLYPATLIADGQVLAKDDQQDLRADYLSLAMAPTTRPSGKSEQLSDVEPQRVIAHGNVTVSGRDNQKATASDLLLEYAAGQPTVTLLGEPAVVQQRDVILRGPKLRFDGIEQTASVMGPGSLTAVQRTKPDDPGRPVEVTWDGGVTIDGRRNTGECTGNVRVNSTGADGRADTARAGRATLALADAPEPAATTRPATVAAAPATRPAGSQLGDALKNKIVNGIRLMEDAEVSSVLIDADGKLLRRTVLRGQDIDYAPGKPGAANEQSLTVPGPGTMLIEDHRPAEKTDANANLRGSTAIQWQKRLVYSEAESTARIEGQVQIARRGTDEGEVMQVTGESFSAELEERPAGTATTASTTQPVDLLSDLGTRMQVRAIHGEGRIVCKTSKFAFETPKFDYDPRTSKLTATASDRQRVRWMDPQTGTETGSASRIVVDTRTLHIEAIEASGRVEIKGGFGQ